MLLNEAWVREFARRAAVRYAKERRVGMHPDDWLAAAVAKEQQFWACVDLVRAGEACWVDGWRAVTYGAGPGDDRYAGTVWATPGDERFRNLYAGKAPVKNA